jgi:hypothetical protein
MKGREEMSKVNFILTKGGAHVAFDGQQATVARTDPEFEALVALLKRGADPADVHQLLRQKEARVAAAAAAAGSARLQVAHGAVLFDGEPVAGLLAERMLQMAEEGFDLGPMERFLVNLRQNPSAQVADRLYAFLEHGKSPLTEDGCFLTYKAVRENYRDIHSGAYDNSVGQVVQVPRNKVDDRHEITCSFGLHVCSFDYLPHFSHANGHVMVCKVNPADVVAVPPDYNNTKMRVCRYEVVDEYRAYYEQQRKAGDTLASSSVRMGLEDAVFEVQGLHRGEWVELSQHERLSDAAHALDEEVDAADHPQVRLVNRVTAAVIDTRDCLGYEEEPWYEADEEDEEGGEDAPTLDDEAEAAGDPGSERLGEEGPAGGAKADAAEPSPSQGTAPYSVWGFPVESALGEVLAASIPSFRDALRMAAEAVADKALISAEVRDINNRTVRVVH